MTLFISAKTFSTSEELTDFSFNYKKGGGGWVVSIIIFKTKNFYQLRLINFSTLLYTYIYEKINGLK